MDRDMILDHLRQAERHVADGERVLEHQRAVIDHLRRAGQEDSMIGAAESLPVRLTVGARLSRTQ